MVYSNLYDILFRLIVVGENYGKRLNPTIDKIAILDPKKSNGHPITRYEPNNELMGYCQAKKPEKYDLFEFKNELIEQIIATWYDIDTACRQG